MAPKRPPGRARSVTCQRVGMPEALAAVIMDVPGRGSRPVSVRFKWT